MSTHQSPRIRRLKNDLAALERLRSESSVFRFRATGNPPHQYQIVFHGRGLWRDRSKVKGLDRHRVEIKLGASYPRNMPEIRWVTPIYHPNITEIGMVCLGGYGTHWVPSLQLDELCGMLWDMVRYHNYDIRSPYNREAALWVSTQTTFRFPTDARPLRDLRASQGRAAPDGAKAASASDSSRAAAGLFKASRSGDGTGASARRVARVLQFIERYGKVFGNGSTPDSARATENRAELVSRPAVAFLRELMDYSAAFPRNGEASLQEGSNAHAEPSGPAVVGSTEVTPPVDADQASSSGERDDVMIVEASTDRPRREELGRDEDVIIFLD
jgi:ubiquitin-protein ligase